MRTVQTIISFSDDLNPDAEATVQIPVSVNGEHRLLQLSADNHRTFSEIFAPWWDAAQPQADGVPDIREWVASGQSPFPADTLKQKESRSGGRKWSPRPKKEVVEAYETFAAGLRNAVAPELPVAGLIESEADEPTDRADLSLVPPKPAAEDAPAEDSTAEEAEDRSTFQSPSQRYPKNAKERKQIREWAERHFTHVPPRGRIPRHMVAAYYRENPAA